jgi:uncharacterized membrane protein required for colicin V production
MGLDIALGIVVLLWAIRGWFKGFVLQAIGLSALVGSLYLANPLRDALRPQVTPHLASMNPALLDRLLWWSCAVFGFVAMAGLGSWLVRARRRRPYGLVEPNRADQGAGFLFGAAKGLVAAAFLASAAARFAPRMADPSGIVHDQANTSQALAWDQAYRPAEQIWNSAPVQSVVAHVQRNGLWAADPAPGGDDKPAVAEPPSDRPKQAAAPSPESRKEPPGIRTARRAPPMAAQPERRLDPDSPDFLRDVDRELERLGLRPGKPH